MKKILTTTAMAMVSLGVLAQGTVNFATVGSGPNGSVNAPATNKATGLRVTGTDYMAQLFYNDPANSADDAIDPRIPGGTTPLLTAVGATATFTTGAAEAARGYITGTTGGGTRTLDGVAGGSQATVQIRAWSASLGQTWDAALNAWRSGAPGVLGGSGVFNIPTGNPPLVAPSALTGVNPGFFLNPVPEPSTIALGILGGLGTLLLFRRRK
jgi:hypothetical protein